MPFPSQRRSTPVSVTALSATDAWLVTDGQPGGVFHFVKGAWRSFTLPPDSGGSGLLVLSDHDIWVIGGTLPGCYSY